MTKTTMVVAAPAATASTHHSQPLLCVRVALFDTLNSVCVYICEQKMKMTTTTEKRKNQPTHIEIKLISKRF